MKRINAIIFGFVIGILLGLWFGFNMGKDRPLFSNPFAEAGIQDRIKETGDSLIEKGGEVLEKSGQALQKKSRDADGEPPAIPQQYPPR